MTTFNHTQIEGMLSLEEATAELVRLATKIQSTHKQETTLSAFSAAHLFESRKAGVVALLTLIEEYTNQM